MKKRIGLVSLLLCLLMLFTACGGSGGSQPATADPPVDAAAPADSGASAPAGPAPSGPQAEKSVKEENWDTLVYAMTTEPAKLDPQNDTLLNTMFVNKQIYNTLVVRNELTGEIEPSLAKSWEWLDDTTLVMELRDDVYFHNGEKLTAEDVIFSVRRYGEGIASSTIYKAFDGENSRVLEDYKVEIKLRETYGPAMSMLASMKGAIVSKKYAESVDEATFSREPVGTGPFKFVSWTTGDNITLIRNDEYWGYKPSYTNLIMRVIPDNSARAIEVETGGVDIVDTLVGDDLMRYMNNEVPGVVAYTIGGTKTHYLAFSDDDPILSNEKVRQAFAYAIDPAAAVDVGFGLGTGAELAVSSMASSIIGYQPQPQREVDAERAKQLLAEAGYADGFTCALVVSEGVHNVRMGEVMQAMLREIGVTMEVTPFNAATWQSMARDGSAKLSIQNLTVDTFDPDQNYSNHYADSTNKVVRTYDETVNRLLNEGRSELDNTKRLAIYAELQKYMYDHAIQIDLGEPIINYAAKDYIEGFVPNPGVQPDLTRITINH